MRSNQRLFKAVFIIYLFFFSSTTAIENKILFKVNNQIITSIDILNEINYLSFINSDFQKLDKQRMYEVSKNSLIREKIKEIDLKSKFIKISLEEKYLNDLIKNFSKRNGFENIDDFYSKLKNNNIKIEEVKKKLTIETFWSQLIIDKFLKNVKIDEINIKKELKEKKNKKNIYYQKSYST